MPNTLNSSRSTRRDSVIVRPVQQIRIPVLPTMPILHVSFEKDPFLETMILGETKLTRIFLLNNGSAPIKKLEIKVTHPTFCIFSINGNRKAVFASNRKLDPVGQSLAYNNAMILNLEELMPINQGETKTIFLLTRAGNIGEHHSELLFYYAPDV